MKQRSFAIGISAVVFATALAVPVSAHQSTGAIFTTVADGSEVNFNQYASKNDVYLDGGPGPGAPQTAAGLTDAIYVFQVTDPSGKTLLSTDPVKCRRFQVTNGIISAYLPGAGCSPSSDGTHLLGTDVDHGAVTIQLMPYNDTPNPGGVYKAWVTFESDYLAFCNNENNADCNARGTFHGFGPSHSKTDNFKAKSAPIREIDTRFFQDVDGDGFFTDGVDNWLDGMQVTWTDTLGASNLKSSYLNLALDVHHEAHVEGVENGTHRIAIASQSGCANVGQITVNGVLIGAGPQTISVKVAASDKTLATQIWAACS
jgi:hypothetical protein